MTPNTDPDTRRCAIQQVTLVRHGYRLDWELPARAYMRHHAQLDTPLAEIGRHQALVTADRLAKATNPVTAIRSSPFRRCVETADAISKACSAPVDLDWRLGEVLEARLLPDGWNPAAQMDGHLRQRRNQAVGQAPYPENTAGIEARIRALCVELNRNMKAGTHLVLVSHAGVLAGLTNGLSGRELYSDWTPCALTSLVRKSGRDRYWNVVGDVAQRDHLGATYRDPPTIRSTLEQEARS